MCIGIILFMIGAVLFGLSATAVLEYNEWKNATYGQCRYLASIAIECRGTRNCRGWTLGHQYTVHNETEAFASCAEVVYHKDEDSCVCNAAEVSDYSLPSSADGEYHDCYIKSCDAVHFGAPSTKSQYASSATMFAIGVVLLCSSFVLCVYGRRKRKTLDDPSVSKSELDEQQPKEKVPKRRLSGTTTDGVTATSQTETETKTAPTVSSMVTVKSESTLNAVPEAITVVGADQSVAL